MDFPGKEQFQAALGSDFKVPFDDGTSCLLHLDKVDDKHHLDTEDTENFALVFSGPVEYPLGQTSFHLEHASLGKLFMFVVPIQETDGRYIYEAVFSLKRERT